MKKREEKKQIDTRDSSEKKSSGEENRWRRGERRHNWVRGNMEK